MLDTGAAITVISEGAVKLLGWQDLVKPAEGNLTFNSAIGLGKYSGILKNV